MLRIICVIFIYIILMIFFITNVHADAYVKHMGRQSAILGRKLQNNLASNPPKSKSGDMADTPSFTSNRAYKRANRQSRRVIPVRR